MKQIPQYSLVIFPTQEQIALIHSYKQSLKKEIGWFGSANSAAHITIIQFNSEMELMLYMEQIRDFCKTIIPQNLTFNSFNDFDGRTFFIAPEAASQHFLDKLIIDLHQHLGFKAEKAHAHISIARRLTSEKAKIAYNLFKKTNLNLTFPSDFLSVRKFNEQTKQYSDIVEKISFGR